MSYLKDASDISGNYHTIYKNLDTSMNDYINIYKSMGQQFSNPLDIQQVEDLSDNIYTGIDDLSQNRYNLNGIVSNNNYYLDEVIDDINNRDISMSQLNTYLNNLNSNTGAIIEMREDKVREYNNIKLDMWINAFGIIGLIYFYRNI